MLKERYAEARAPAPFAWDDAFCYATALACRADAILTSNQEFRHVREVRVIDV